MSNRIAQLVVKASNWGLWGLCGAVLIVGCGSSPTSADLARAITRDVGDRDFRVERVVCSQAREPCRAEVHTLNGTVRMPVTVTQDRWEVAAEDLFEARQGPTPKPARVGQKIVALGGEGQKLEFTVTGQRPLEAVYPNPRPDLGNIYVGLGLRARNVGTTSLASSVGATLRLLGGTQVDPSVAFAGDCEGIDSLPLRPGQEVSGCIPFEVPEDSVVESALVGSDVTQHILEWDFR